MEERHSGYIELRTWHHSIMSSPGRALWMWHAGATLPGSARALFRALFPRIPCGMVSAELQFPEVHGHWTTAHLFWVSFNFLLYLKPSFCSFLCLVFVIFVSYVFLTDALVFFATCFFFFFHYFDYYCFTDKINRQHKNSSQLITRVTMFIY